MGLSEAYISSCAYVPSTGVVNYHNQLSMPSAETSRMGGTVIGIHSHRPLHDTDPQSCRVRQSGSLVGKKGVDAAYALRCDKCLCPGDRCFVNVNITALVTAASNQNNNNNNNSQSKLSCKHPILNILRTDCRVCSTGLVEFIYGHILAIGR